MDDWAWEQLQPWPTASVDLPVGPLLCIATGPTCGRAWSPGAARTELRHAAARAGLRKRFVRHPLRHAHSVEMAREGVPLIVIQRQLGHSNLGITSLGRGGARCRRCRRSVSPRRPPNRTCAFPRIRLSTGRALADRDAGSGNGASRWSGGSACSGGRPRRGDVVAAIAVSGHRDLVGPGEPRAFAPGPVVPQHRRLICFQVSRGTPCAASGSPATTGSG
jgi:hypothetical protein